MDIKYPVPRGCLQFVIVVFPDHTHLLYRTITEFHNGSNNQQRINNNRTTAWNGQRPKPLGGGGGVNAFYWYQIFDLATAVVEARKMLRC